MWTSLGPNLRVTAVHSPSDGYCLFLSDFFPILQMKVQNYLCLCLDFLKVSFALNANQKIGISVTPGNDDKAKGCLLFCSSYRASWSWEPRWAQVTENSRENQPQTPVSGLPMGKPWRVCSYPETIQGCVRPGDSSGAPVGWVCTCPEGFAVSSKVAAAVLFLFPLRSDLYVNLRFRYKNVLCASSGLNVCYISFPLLLCLN